MIEAFANESETANIDNENPTALLQQAPLAQRRDRTSQVKDITIITFFTNREDGSRLIPPSPTAHTPEYSGEKTDLQNDQQSNATRLFSLVLSEPTSRV